MTRTVMIDLPSVLNKDSKINSSVYLSIIEGIRNLKGLEIIYSDDILLSLSSYEEMSLFIDIMGRKRTRGYDSGDLDKASHTRTEPELRNISFPEELNNHICLQAHTLHVSPNTLFLVSGTRWKDKDINLKTIRNRHTLEHTTLITENDSSIRTYVMRQQPHLDQHKHNAKRYSNADKDVSPFSAYNPRNEEPARQLLRDAYDKYMGDEVFPHYLYTWDTHHKTFVEFRRSTTDGGYHGFDCKREKVDPNLLKRLHK